MMSVVWLQRVAHQRLYFLTDAPRHPQIERLRDSRAEIVAWEGFQSFVSSLVSESRDSCAHRRKGP